VYDVSSDRQAKAAAKRRIKEEARDIERAVRRAADDLGSEARRAAEDLAREARRAARDDAGPIWTRPAPGARQPRLTREEIAAAALRIADAEGIDAVSMRRVATALEAGTMSLYYYVQSKDELLDLMNDAMVGEVLVPEGELPQDWRAALTAIAMRSLAAFNSHPWAIHAPPATPGPNTMRHIDQSLAAVAGLGLDLGTRFEIISMVDDYLLGYLMRATEEEVPPDIIVGYFEEQIATGEYPHLAELVEGRPVRAAIEELAELARDDRRFARGLARMLDGVAIQLGLE
jgi:AcrR family transcriptional regulator